MHKAAEVVLHLQLNFLNFSEIGFRCFQKDFSAFASSETKVGLSFNPEMQASQVSNSETGALIQSLNTSQLRVLNEG